MKNVVAYLAALGPSAVAFAVSVDLHNSEVQPAVLVILVGGFILGAFAPAHAWRWVVIPGSPIFLGDNLAPRLGLAPGVTVLPWNYGTILALIPATIGTYVGVFVRRMLGSAEATLD